MNRTGGTLLFWMAVLLQITGCFSGPVSSNLVIKGVKEDIDKTNILSYKILFNQVSFNLPNHLIRIIPFKLGFDPFYAKKDLFFRFRNLHALEGVIRLAEIYEGNELFLFVADEARRDFLFLGGHSINPGKIIAPDRHNKARNWLEMEITTPEQTRISVETGQPVTLKANGELWELMLIGCSETASGISGMNPAGFSADFVAYKLGAVKKR
jgi:hypothetical protein